MFRMSVDFEYVEVKKAKEDWNIYKLDDGAEVRTKFVLVKVIRQKGLGKAGTPIYGVNSTNAVGVFVPKRLRDKPSSRKYSRSELEKSITKRDLDYNTKRESWNRYVLEDGTVLQIKLAMVEISKTDKFDNKGEPIYIVRTNPLIKGVPSEKVKRLVERSRKRRK